MKLKNQILTALILSGLLPLAIAFIYAIWHSSNITSKISLEAAEERLQVAAEKLSSYFSSRLLEIEMLAQNQQVRSMDFRSMRPYLIENLQRKSQHYEKFIIGRDDGSFHNTAGGNPHLNMLRTFNDNSPTAKLKSISKRDYWQQTVGHNLSGENRLYISNPMISYTTEVKQIVVTSSIMNPQGNITGLLGGALPWKNIQKMINQLQDYLQVAFSGKAQLALISKDGTYWYHWNPDKVIHLARDNKGKFILNTNGEKQTIQTKLQNSEFSILRDTAALISGGGISKITVQVPETSTHHIFIPVSSSGYTLQLAVPDNVLEAPTLSLVKALTAVFVATSLIAIVLTLFISKRLTAPLLNFTSSVENIVDGDLKRVDIFSKTQEFNHLVSAFNNMLKTIKHREQSLFDSEERFSLAMQGANDGLWDWDMLSNKVYYSPRWKHMLGYNESELENVYSTWEKLIHKDDLNSIRKSLNDYIEGRSSTLDTELRMLHKDGHTVFIRTRGFLTRNSAGTAERMVGTNIDITSRKQYETQLQELNINLEKRVLDRTQELEKLNKDLLDALNSSESANQAKGTFLANMSHEIRTPMNGIIGLTELTLRTELDTKQREFLTKLKSAADQLLHILNDILDFSKIEAGKLDIESISFNFPAAIENVVSIFNVKATEKNLDLILNVSDNISEKVIGDQFRLTQILSNLTSNAIKFTEQGSVTITIKNDIKKDFLHFSVADTGIGIAKDIQNELFNSFTQADNTTSRRFGGTGLGLAISKHLIEMMKGDVTLISNEGEGCTINFTLYLPADTTNSSTEITTSDITSNHSTHSFISEKLSGKNALLVEDVKVNQLIASELLKQAGLTVSIANDGEEAVKMANEKIYDLVLMDIQMPKMDGYEATRLIRNIDTYKNIPIIAMTANAMEADRQRSYNSGMNGHISKPLDTDTLIANIESYCDFQ